MSGSAEITRQNVSAFNVISPVGSEVMAEVRGSYRGDQVTLSSADSKLADAAEELGMSVAHRADKKSLGQRSVRQGQASFPEAIARLQEYLKELPDMPRDGEITALVEKLQSFQDLLQGSGSHGSEVTKEDVLAALHAFDGDVTHQYAGLEIAREQFQAMGADPAFLSLLDETHAEFQKTGVARDVQAGFAAAEVAARSAETLESDPATVRDVYRSMLRESMNIGQLFDALGKFAVLKSFGEAVETFMTAAGRDLASTGPSTDPDFLHSLLTELGKLKKMQTTLDATGDLVRLTERALPAPLRGRADIVDQTSRILNFASQPAASQADTRRLLGSFAEGSPSLQVAFANGLRLLHRNIPDDVMPSMQARLQQVKSIMSLLDELVEAEEADFDAANNAEKISRAGGR